MIIVDDALNLRDAGDVDKVEAVNRIFDGEITSRLNTPRRGRIIVIAHRLAENDLSALLKKAPKPGISCFPWSPFVGHKFAFLLDFGFAKKVSCCAPARIVEQKSSGSN
jgi:hypothetical protein